MNSKLKKALILFGPLLAGGGLIVYLNLKKKKKMDNAPVVAPGQDIAATVETIAPVASSLFPLRNGVSNVKVKELQGILGVTADGAFGPKTEAALVSLGGMRTIDSQEQLDALKKQAAGVSNLSRANDLALKFLKGGQSIYVINTAQLPQVMEDSYGAIIRTGKYLKLTSGIVYNNTDYQLTKSTKAGNVLMNITRGNLLGTYEVNPNNITLKAS